MIRDGRRKYRFDALLTIPSITAATRPRVSGMNKLSISRGCYGNALLRVFSIAPSALPRVPLCGEARKIDSAATQALSTNTHPFIFCPPPAQWIIIDPSDRAPQTFRIRVSDSPSSQRGLSGTAFPSNLRASSSNAPSSLSLLLSVLDNFTRGGGGYAGYGSYEALRGRLGSMKLRCSDALSDRCLQLRVFDPIAPHHTRMLAE